MCWQSVGSWWCAACTRSPWIARDHDGGGAYRPWPGCCIRTSARAPSEAPLGFQPTSHTARHRRTTSGPAARRTNVKNARPLWVRREVSRERRRGSETVAETVAITQEMRQVGVFRVQRLSVSQGFQRDRPSRWRTYWGEATGTAADARGAIPKLADNPTTRRRNPQTIGSMSSTPRRTPPRDDSAGNDTCPFRPNVPSFRQFLRPA